MFYANDYELLNNSGDEMKVTAMCLLIMGRKIVAKVDKSHVTLPGGKVDEASAQEQLKEMVEQQCGIVSTKPVLIFSDKAEKKQIYIAYVNTQKSESLKSSSRNADKLETGDWELMYADKLKEQIDSRHKNDQLLYSVLSVSMSLIKLILDKKTVSSKNIKQHISSIAAVFRDI
jgi:hypothetical protein